MTGRRPEPLPSWVAAAVTFLCSGAVLVLEIVGLRLIAPYVGVTLQTSTAIIGFALAAIAIGAWTGGATADRTDPRRLIAPLMVAGGALVVAVLPLVRFTGSLLTGADAGGVLLLAAVAVVVPAALLSAVPPMVVKLQLASLAETGAVVGRLSGIGTLGGIAATFVTGFLLIAILPSSVILVGTGGLTVVAGIAVGVLLRRRTGGGARPGARRPARARGGRCRARRRGADPVRGGDRLPLRPGGRRSRTGLRPGADARHAAALLRRPGRPDAPRVRVRAGDRGGHRRHRAAPGSRCRRCTSAAAGSPCRATSPRSGRAPRAW